MAGLKQQRQNEESQSAVSHRHASALLVSELSNAVCARNAAVPHFAASMSIQVVGLSEDRYHPLSKPVSHVADLKPLQKQPESEECHSEMEVKPICTICRCGYSLSVLHHFD